MEQRYQPKTIPLSRWLECVEELWHLIIVERRHLDSALSRSPQDLKSHLASFLPAVLRRPDALYRTFGLDPKKYINPWDLPTVEERGTWKTLRPLAHHYWKICSLEGEISAQPPAVLLRQISESQKSVTSADYPPWLLEEFEADWGEETATQLVSALANDPPLSLRAAMKMGADRLLKSLGDQVELPRGSAVSSRVESCVHLPRYTSVLNTSLYRDGLFEIQDEGSQLIALFTLNPTAVSKRLALMPAQDFELSSGDSFPAQIAPMTAVDACAGAGGKSLAMADYLRGSGRLFSYDISEKKIQALRLRARRSGHRSIKAISLIEGNESETLAPFFKSADRVLVDAPCSGIGILKRSPDIKWNQTSDDFAELSSVQLRLLQVYSQLVKPGGLLIYSTCTFRRAECTEVVDRFLKEQPVFQRGAGGFFGPFSAGGDGFFMQEFRRES